MGKLYTSDLGRFPIRSQGGNQYIMIAYHFNSNIIFKAAFNTCSGKHRREAYNYIQESLEKHGHKVKLQILDNEASSAYKKSIEDTWHTKYQLILPDLHHCNAAERSIRTLKRIFWPL